jgi:seryl-tRNA synthetase
VETKTKQPPPAKKNSKTTSADEAGGGNIDKVRDILFGGQMRDYERRFVRFEERLAQETAELKEDMRKRLAALEQFVKQETASMADRIKAEHDERTAAAKDLTREVREGAKAFEKKTAQIDDQIEKLQRELRKQILDLHKRLSDDLREKIDDVMARLSQESSDLRNDKMDRAALAALLNEMALRLSSESPKPGADNGRKG